LPKAPKTPKAPKETTLHQRTMGNNNILNNDSAWIETSDISGPSPTVVNDWFGQSQPSWSGSIPSNIDEIHLCGKNIVDNAGIDIIFWFTKVAPTLQETSLPTLQYQKKSEIFCATAVCWKNMKKESFNVVAFTHFFPSLWDGTTNFLLFTWSIDSVLLAAIESISITPIIHMVWCCFLVYGLTLMQHRQLHHFTVAALSRKSPYFTGIGHRTINFCVAAIRASQ
jgi:hypothetical protein